MVTSACQLCGSQNLKIIIDLGNHPLADTFLAPEQVIHDPVTYPLRVMQCSDCGYTTLDFIVPPAKRYQEVDYSYTSANSPVAVKHFAEMAEQAAKRINLSSDDLAVDIGSNDGTLLAAFRDQAKTRVVGIEPAANVAALARDNNIETIVDFFNTAVVQDLLKRHGNARVITATNVFNHITDLPRFMKDIYKLLTDDGVFVFETPYLLHLVQQRAFDTIYLEHVSYFSLKPFRDFFRKFNLYVSHIEENNYMGGSIRVYLSKHAPETDALAAAVEREDAARIHDTKTYTAFMLDVQSLKQTLMETIREVKKNGGKIIGIGAATKGNTLLNYCGIDSTLLEFITDSTPLKVGKYTPGSKIPIKKDSDITTQITHAVILPWNIADFLKEKLKHLNLKFITPRIKKYETRTS